ncbi:MAG: transcription initiation factor IIB [Candidatus Nanohaloarchaea archaeon]|nr:transcription initiation factor IIB [Candidatus Nanohaloarchaea archaeon]
MVEEARDMAPQELEDELDSENDLDSEAPTEAPAGPGDVPRSAPNEVPNPAQEPGPVPEQPEGPDPQQEGAEEPEEGSDSSGQKIQENELSPRKTEDEDESSADDDAGEGQQAVQRPECPECGERNFSEDTDKGELVCNNCGMVIDEEMIDESPEWRAFNAEQREKKERAGAPLTYTKHDMGVSTEIGKGSGELYKVSGKKRAQYYRMRKWHNRLTKSKDRNLGFALSELNRMVSHLNLPESVHEEVARLYEKAVDKGLVRGRSMESVIAALLYIVARQQGTPRTLDEIHETSGIDKREIGRTYRYVARELDLRILPAKPQDHIPRFAGKLELSGEVQARARKIIQEAREQNLLSGKGPTGIAAAALYIAAVLEGEKRTQREVADIVGVTEVTIRNRYKELVENLGLEEEIENKQD